MKRTSLLVLIILLWAGAAWAWPGAPYPGLATETSPGLSERCTDAEMTTGTKADCDVTPANAKVELDKKLPISGAAASLHIDDILTALGIASEAVHFGTFTGSIIPASSTAKVALQAVETAVETKLNLAPYTGGGTAQAHTVTLSPAWSTLVGQNGKSFEFIAVATNTATAPTLAVNGLTAGAMTKQGGVALMAGDIRLGQTVKVTYVESGNTWDIGNPANPTSSATDNVAVSNFPWKNSAGGYVSAIASASTPGLSIVNNKTFTVNNTLTLSGTDSTTMTFPSTSATIARTDAGQTFTGVNIFTAPTFTTSIAPTAAGGSTIGTTSAEWGHVYLTDSAVIYAQADQSNTMTSAATGWTFNKKITVSDVTNDNYIAITNNSGGRAPTASSYEIYPDAGAFKANQNGTEYNIQMAGACTALTPGAAVTLTVAATNCYTDTVTDNQDQTITFSGAGYAGQEVTIIFTTAGSSDEVITFHATLVSSTGTLTLGTDAGKYYVVRFISNGTHWFEVSRTAVQT